MWKSSLVGTAHPVAHHGHIAVGHYFKGLCNFNGSQVAGLAAEVLVNLGQASQSETLPQPGQLADFDLVHVMVAAHQQQPHLALDNFAFFVGVVCRQHQ
jgi:hypothetical protein